jgi:dihydroorotate dehydrogenase
VSIKIPVQSSCGADTSVCSLSDLQNGKLLNDLLSGVTKARDELQPSTSMPSQKPKLVLKIAPDLSESDLIGIADALRCSSIDGVIVCNTTVQRPSHLTDRKLNFHLSIESSNEWVCVSANKTEAGGLSGSPLKPYSLSALRILRAHLSPSVVLIGCGGITSGDDVLEYAKAGASLVQIYTSFGYNGAGTCRRIKDQLVEALEKEGTTWQEVVDAAAQERNREMETRELKSHLREGM